jgi:hypothetical protein
MTNNTMDYNEEVVEMVENEEVAATTNNEDGVEEVVETGNNNQGLKLIGTAIGSAVAGAVTGWFGRGALEKRKREKMFDEIQKQLYLIEASAQGHEEVEWDGKLYTTKGIHVMTTEELKAYIMDRILGNMKVKDYERQLWNNLLTTIVTVEERIIINSKIVVDEK